MISSSGLCDKRISVEGATNVETATTSRKNIAADMGAPADAASESAAMARLRGAWAEINLANLKHNLRVIKSLAPKSDIIGIVKADAYGHGAVPVSKALAAEGVRRLAVATLQEGVELREAGIGAQIIVLGLLSAEGMAEAMDRGLTPVLAKPGDGEALSRWALRRGAAAEAFVALETGMGREGFMADEEGFAALRRLRMMPGVSVAGFMSHLSSADEADLSYAREQVDRTRKFVTELKKLGYAEDFVALAASSGIVSLPESHFEAVRPGIMMYGCQALEDGGAWGLLPVMSVKARVACLRRVPTGFTVGYGRTYATERESLIGTLPLGYADGLPRSLSGRGEVIVKGCRAPIVGRICMDTCMADLTDVPGASEGDEATVMGADGDISITAVDIAEKTGTISHEVFCGFGRRLPRVYCLVTQQ